MYKRLASVGVFVALLLMALFTVGSAEAKPLWLKEGTFAEYEVENASIFTPQKDFHRIRVVFRWEVRRIKGDFIELRVYLNASNFGFKSVEVKVDADSREVIEPRRLGKTSLWIEEVLKIGQSIILSGKEPNEIKGVVESSGRRRTIQGMQACYNIEAKHVFTLYGSKLEMDFFYAYDADTGLLVAGIGLADVTLDLMEVSFIRGALKLKATNVDLGPEEIYLIDYLYYYHQVIIFVATFSIFSTLLWRRWRKRMAYKER